MRAPTYGVLIAIIEPTGKEKILEICTKVGYPCTFLPPLKDGRGLYVDEKLVDKQIRIDLDEIYGSFKPKKI